MSALGLSAEEEEEYFQEYRRKILKVQDAGEKSNGNGKVHANDNECTAAASKASVSTTRKS